MTLEAIAHTYRKDASISLVSVILERGAKARGDIVDCRLEIVHLIDEAILVAGIDLDTIGKLIA